MFIFIQLKKAVKKQNTKRKKQAAILVNLRARVLKTKEKNLCTLFFLEYKFYIITMPKAKHFFFSIPLYSIIEYYPK